MNNHSLLHRILFNPTYAAGLDIQDRKLRLAHVQPGKSTLTTIHEHELEEGVVENGEILDERELARHLADALRASGIKNGYYVTHTPAQHTALRLLTFPAMPAKELKSAVRYEASRNLPYSLADAAISYSPIEQAKPKKTKAKKTPRKRNKKHNANEEPAAAAEEAEVATPEPSKNEEKGVRGKQPKSFLVAATPNAHVLKLMRVAKAAGIRLGVIEPRTLATLRALNHHNLISTDEIILDIGDRYSNLTVTTKGAVALARTLPYGQNDLQNATQHAIDGFNRDMTLTLEYITRLSETLQLNRLISIGGELHPGISTSLEGLGLDVHTATPPEGINPTDMTAYGLALRGSKGV